jgi:hypothetical protein
MGNRRFKHRPDFRRTLAATACGFALLTGCATTPWGLQGSSPAKSASSSEKKTSPPPAKSSGAKTDAQTEQEAIRELQQVGALDSEAIEKLMADLKQVDPSLRPMVLQTFLAKAAYRRRVDQLEATKEKPEPAASSTPREYPSSNAKAAGEQETRFELNAPDRKSSLEPSPKSTSESRPSVTARSPSAPASFPKAESIARTAAAAPQPSSLSIANTDNRLALSPESPALAGVETGSTTTATMPAKSDRDAPAPAPPSAALRLAAIRGEASTPVAAPAAGAAASAGAPLSEADWQAHLTAAIHAIELQSKTGSKNESDVALQARLRMLYLLAGRRDDAMRPLPAAPRATQDYWSSQIYGLSTWMDAEKTPDASRRAAETKRILGEALGQLGETAPLAVRNLAFCTEVFRFGSFEAVKNTEFTSGQKVLLYAEVDNLHIDSSAKGFHWVVKINGQIFDTHGNRMTDFGSTTAEEYFQTPRHDFFVSKLYILPRLAPGRYTLTLTIEDTLGHKVGQSSIDFTAKP